MKTKPLVLVVALFLSLTLLAGKTLAQGAAVPSKNTITYVNTYEIDSMVCLPLTSFDALEEASQPVIYSQSFGTEPQTLYANQSVADLTPVQGAPLPTTPTYFNPADPTQPQPPLSNPGDGMNLNFIGAISNPSPEVDPNPIKVTKKDAVENTTPKNIITVPLGRQISIYLKKKSFQGDPGERWFLEINNDHIQSLNSNGVPYVNTALVQTLEDVESGYNGPFRYSDWYIFKACSLGATVLTFQTNDELVCHPETLTFRFNVVEAPAAPAPSEYGDASSGK